MYQNNNNEDNPALSLIYDNANVSETNHLKSLLEIVIKLCVILTTVYIFIFISLGIIIDNLPIEKQIKLENFIANTIYEPNNIATKEETLRLEKIKQNILNVDYSFPKTSKLNIIIINDKEKNALCLPNGNIYITSALFEKLTNDEMLTFVIAHEMAHYKNKDHLKNIRHEIASAIILSFLQIANPSDTTSVKILEGGLNMSNLNFSRSYEKKADIYAGKVLLALYGNNKAGADVLNNLRDKKYPPVLMLFSTHPDVDSRIQTLNSQRKYNVKY